nr:hypothetical protein [Neisseria meningitidis]
MSDKEPPNRNPVIASRRKCRLKYSSDGIFREGRDALEKTAFQAFIVDEQKPVRYCLALAERERFSQVLKHQSESVRVLYCLRLRRLVPIFVTAASSACPDFC